jgi:hypothetical protein
MRSENTTKALFAGAIVLLLVLLVIIYRTLTLYPRREHLHPENARALRELETVFSTVKDAETALSRVPADP